jgi:hypothetical protein
MLGPVDKSQRRYKTNPREHEGRFKPSHQADEAAEGRQSKQPTDRHFGGIAT